MSRNKPTKPMLGPEWIIARVAFDIQHPMLYANGRQQSKVIAYIEAQKNAQRVKLTATERASIRLIDYMAPDAEIPFANDATGESYKGWSAQREPRGYLFHPATLTQDKASPDETTPMAGGDYVELFVTADAGAVGGPLSLAFVVTGDNGWRYRTDGYVFAPDGTTAFNEIIDTGRDKSVRPDTPLAYGRGQFQLEQLRHTDKAAIFNDTVTLSIQDGRVIALKHMQCTPAGMIHWIDNLPSTQNPCYTGYAEPGDTHIHWNEAVPTGGQPRPTLAAAEPGKGVIMLCGRIDIPRRDHVDPPLGPMIVTMIDAYGSDQTCSIEFVPGTRDELQVT